MPLQPPNLDDRRYADIIAEAKALIPRYTPEWTDYNESDPGITLLELFAWMTDILIYRLNQVPERNHLKFLQLLGTELLPAEPARADLTFTLNDGVKNSVTIPRGAQVAASAADGKPLTFETTTDLIVLAAVLKEIQTFDGDSYSLQTNKNNVPGQGFYPFGPTPRTNSALLLGFDAPDGGDFRQQQLDLMVYVADSLKAQRYVTSGITQTAQATILWEYYTGEVWRPLQLDKDNTHALTTTEHISLNAPGNTCRKALIGLVDTAYYWIRARIQTTHYDQPPYLEAIQINTVGALQKVTIEDEALGISNGQPEQTFALAKTPVVVRDIPLLLTEPLDPNDRRPTKVYYSPATSYYGKRPLPPVLAKAQERHITVTSLQLQIDEGDGRGYQTWQEVPDFYASGPEDMHYTLNRNTGIITFGDGEHGRIPLIPSPSKLPSDRAPEESILAREYSFGGGKRGSVAENTINQLQTVVKGAASIKGVTNLRPSVGGSDEETLEEAKKRVPQTLKNKGRAVTAEDFEALATETPAVRIRRAKARPLFHPDFPDLPVPGTVTVVVVPDCDLDTPAPTPNQATLTLVSKYLDSHRLLTSEVYVVPPTYRTVSVEAKIIVKPEASMSLVKQQVEENLKAYFHPLFGGDNGQGWEFGGAIYYSKVYRTVLQIDGIDHIEGAIVISVDNQQQTPYQDIPLGEGNLPNLADIAIYVTL